MVRIMVMFTCVNYSISIIFFSANLWRCFFPCAVHMDLLPSLETGFLMDHNRAINTLVWKIRGINSQAKWDALRDKISESAASIVCLQETKREVFDAAYLRKFCARNLNHFAFSPSVGASGGLLTIWNSNLYRGTLVHHNSFSITVKLDCNLSRKSFHLTNIYGPSNSVDKGAFIFWLYNLDTTPFDDWILAGDFNFIRCLENRNRPGANINDMLLFNDLI